MRPVIVAALASAALLAGVAPAAAHHQTRPATDQRVIDESVQIARSAWPGSPCHGREDVRIDDAAQAVLKERDAGGIAVPSECIVGMPRDTSVPVTWCAILVHEFGHLAGMGHSDDPRSPMHAPPGQWPGCASLKRFEHRPPFHPLAGAREKLSVRRSHDWTCRRPSRNLVRCDGEPRAGARREGVAMYRRASPRHGWAFSVRYR